MPIAQPRPAEGENHDRPDHYHLAEELLADRGVLDDVLVGVAQAHATLALAAAAMALLTSATAPRPTRGAKPLAPP